MLTRKVNRHLSDNSARKNVVIGDLRDEIRKLEKKKHVQSSVQKFNKRLKSQYNEINLKKESTIIKDI